MHQTFLHKAGGVAGPYPGFKVWVAKYICRGERF